MNLLNQLTLTLFIQSRSTFNFPVPLCLDQSHSMKSRGGTEPWRTNGYWGAVAKSYIKDHFVRAQKLWVGQKK